VPVPFWDDAPGAWDTLSLGGQTMPGLATVQGRVGRKMDTRSRPGADGARVRDRGYEPARLEIHVKVWTPEQLRELINLLAQLHPRNVTPPSTADGSRAERRVQRAAQQVADAKAAADEGPLPSVAESISNRQEIARLEGELAEARAAAARIRNQPRPRATRTPVDIAHPVTDVLGIRRVYVTGIKLPELSGGELVTTITAIEWTDAPRQAPPPSTSSVSPSEGIADVEDAFSRWRAERERARPRPDLPGRLR
jgi:hypothetical protein